jgi:L-fuconolactonase
LGRGVIDAHIHFWRLARGDNHALDPAMAPIYRDREPQHLRPMLDAAGVDRIVVVQAAETLAETVFTLGLAERFPWIAGVVGWADPASPSIEEEIAALATMRRLKGLRPVRDDNRSIAWMLDARLDRGFGAMAAAGLALDILVQNWREIPLATILAARWPDLRIVLDHCGKPDIGARRLEPWADAIDALAALPNVACKFSGLLNCAAPGAGPDELRPYTQHVLTAFGARRVLWASDWPPLDLAADYPRWIAVSRTLLSELSAADRNEVEGGTALRVYRIEAFGSAGS